MIRSTADHRFVYEYNRLARFVFVFGFGVSSWLCKARTVLVWLPFEAMDCCRSVKRK